MPFKQKDGNLETALLTIFNMAEIYFHYIQQYYEVPQKYAYTKVYLKLFKDDYFILYVNCIYPLSNHGQFIHPISRSLHSNGCIFELDWCNV